MNAAEFEEQAFDPDVFFARYWRARPMLIRGGARGFLGRAWSSADFDRVAAAARITGERMKESQGEVTFIEEASAYDADLAERAAGFARQFGVPRVWFDTVRTSSVSGIGAHFDHSDNFVLQQEGVKRWSLASPRWVEDELLRKRMLNTPGIGSHPLPESDTVNFVLEPGDLLYIPLLWLHHGTSDGASLSLSLVCPAVSLYAAIVPFLGSVLKKKLLGAEPVAAFHACLTPEQRAAEMQRIHEATADFLKHVTADDIIQAVCALQERRLAGPHSRS